jgi:hypothetical protein
MFQNKSSLPLCINVQTFFKFMPNIDGFLTMEIIGLRYHARNILSEQTQHKGFSTMEIASLRCRGNTETKHTICFLNQRA